MTSSQKRALRRAGLPVTKPQPPPPPRDALCADDAESGGCYHLAPGAEGREACRANCRMLSEQRVPRARNAAMAVLLLGTLPPGGEE